MRETGRLGAFLPRLARQFSREDIPYGVTGKMVGSKEEAIGAPPAILAYDRLAVRQRFEDRFTSIRMAKDYVSTIAG